jgi:hypothetical protein
MKIIFEDHIFEGSPAEIIDQLRRESFDADSFPDSASFLIHMKATFERMTDMPCELPKGNLDGRATVMLQHLAGIGALEILEGR